MVCVFYVFFACLDKTIDYAILKGKAAYNALENRADAY